MAANAGPDIIEDGIVFYYDTGNTVKSYIGEPTTNYYNSFSVAMPNLSGGNVTTTLPDGTTGTAFRVTVNSNSSTSRCVLYHNLPQPIPQANIRYTISHWIKTAGSVPVAAGWEAEVGASDGYARPSIESGYVGDYGSLTQPNTIASTWTRVSYTFYYTSTKTSALVPFIYFGSPSGGNGDSVGATIDFYGFQIEVNSHATQYTLSSRSVTQGLLDMARNSTINLTDVSFNSTAQITFDGTNDKIHGIQTIHSYLSSSAIEFVVTPTVVNKRMTVGGYRHNDGYSQPTIGMVYIQDDNTFNASVITAAQVYRGVTSTTTVTANKTYHVVFNKNTTTGVMQMFINGVLEATQTFDAATYGQWTTAGSYIGSNILDLGKSYNTSVGQGWGNDFLVGTIPQFKLYSRTLSASEVQTNYNALRTRFGI